LGGKKKKGQKNTSASLLGASWTKGSGKLEKLGEKGWEKRKPSCIQKWQKSGKFNQTANEKSKGKRGD